MFFFFFFFFFSDQITQHEQMSLFFLGGFFELCDLFGWENRCFIMFIHSPSNIHFHTRNLPSFSCKTNSFQIFSDFLYWNCHGPPLSSCWIQAASAVFRLTPRIVQAPRIVCLDSAQEPPLKNRTVAFLRGERGPKDWDETSGRTFSLGCKMLTSYHIIYI